ncbi:MAG: reverse transcriptase domain-containing protein [Patescibacteria group bacterium]
MKIYKKIFNEAVSIGNLLNAWDKFKKGKRQKSDVQMFERNLEDNLFQLHQDLISKKYRHDEYIGFYIRDPKERHIHKATVRDRVVHHAIFQCLNPIFEPTFIFTSYSCRKNKGAHKAVKQLQILARKVQQTYGQCFVLKCDIKKFFPTIDHKILINIIAQRIKDNDMLWLLKTNIESFSSEFSSQNDGAKGTPIGNLTSQLFINIYMNEMDQYIKNNLRVKHYIRYTDDFVVIHYDKNYLLKTKNEIDKFLNEKLKLSLHPNKVEICKYHKGIDFLGYITLPKARLLRTKTKRRIFRKLRQKVKQFKNNEINEESLIQSFNSYLGVLKHANSHKLEQKLRHKLWEWLNEF